MAVYKITMENEKGNLKNYSFYKTLFFGGLWEVVTRAIKKAEEKSNEEKINWAVTDIKRIK